MTLLEVFLESKELKRTIVKRSLDYNIPLRYLCRETGIEYNTFMRGYINAIEWNTYECTEDQFKKLLSILGITVRYQFIIDKDVDMVAKSKELTDKYEEFQKDRRELGRSAQQQLNRKKK